MIDKLEKLKYLKKDYNIIGIKQSFEDEGVLLDDLISIRRMTELANLKTFVKIGGCEAKSDIYNCKKYGIDSVIAPMIESKFALSKFLSSTSNDFDSYIVIETKTAYNNLNEILELGKNHLKGIIVGRSDLTKSFDLNKSEVDSDMMNSIVKDILTKSKEFGYSTTVGGNISIKSSSFFQDLFSTNLLDKIETRNVVIGLNNININKIEETIQQAINFEINLLNDRLSIVSNLLTDYSNRINILSKRK